MIKADIRKLYKQKRISLPVAERLKLDDLLLIQLQRLSFGNNIKTIMSFWPLEHHAEMNTHLFIRYLEYVIPDLAITFPVIHFSSGEIYPVVANDETSFVENAFGIPEPEPGEEILPEEIDVVFVPLLAFDNNGFRVGFGKGFYDRFLKKCRSDIISVGFSYFDPVDKIEDTHQFDVPLKYCITPQKIYEF